ncbi:NAD-dependent protein deacylase [Halomicrobium salinisoli]|uniref:NAD-dependent protein deacylase n=1 Tax=Halomicrobium salinisoli TaxID=2878391 RepID=UPI001CF05EAF|nr:NAD-dependent protein deacylase [Halomicrobium salinisoli]
MDDDVDAIADALREADTAVAFTGAGVSTASGVPSFRGEDGLWEEFDPKSFHRRRLDADPEGWWRDRVELREHLDPGEYEPNAAHEALAELESAGHLDAVVTQNVDGLHGEAGTEELIRLHGTNRRVRCEDCGERSEAAPTFERAREGDVPPRCDCGGLLRPDVVLFGESLPADAIERARRLARESDCYLAVGSSLTVQPAAGLPRRAATTGATLAILNLTETPLDGVADRVIGADVTDVLPALAARV